MVLSRTGYTCDVDPFLGEYESTKAVEIVKCATAVQLSSDLTVYLVMTKALWFGDRLKDSLMNSNIARDAGVDICTDPFDPHRNLGITRNGIFVPMYRRGNSVGLKTFKPDVASVAKAMRYGSSNVIYLNAEQEFELGKNEVDVSALTFSAIKSDNTLSATVSGVNIEDPEPFSDGPEMALLRQVSPVFDPKYFMTKAVKAVQVADFDRPSDESMEVGETPTRISAIHFKKYKSRTTPEDVSRIFRRGLDNARDTIRTTTQNGIRHPVNPLKRRYRTDHMSSNYSRLSTRMYTDTMMFTKVSLKGNKCAQVFTDGAYARAYPLKSKALCGGALKDFIYDVGVPNELLCDNAPEMVGPDTEFHRECRRVRCVLLTVEPYTPKQNLSERVIGELRRRWRDVRTAKNIPRRLWDYVLVWLAEIMSRTYNHKFDCTGLERLTGDTPDITEWVDFDIYDRVWYWDSPHDEENPKLGRWLGVSHRVGSDMCFHVINEKGSVLSRTTVKPVTEAELRNQDIKAQCDLLDAGIKHEMRDDRAPDAGVDFHPEDEDAPDAELFSEQDEAIDNPDPVDPDARVGDIEEPEEVPSDGGLLDQYIGAELIFENEDGSPRKGTVVKRAQGEDGKPLGRYHPNPVVDTRKYIVEFDGFQQELMANQIAENMFSQVDEDGRRELVFRGIIDHRKGAGAIDKSSGTIKTKSGRERPKITTAGWEFKVEWSDGTSSWVPLTEVKNANPIEAAEYAIMAKIDDEPAFVWWVRPTIKKRNQIIRKVKSRYWRTTHKFGIELPHSVAEALAIDRKNGNTFWLDAIEKEMSRVRIAFVPWKEGQNKTVEDARRELVGYTQIDCHMVFDVKMDGSFTRKARLVAGGHMTKAPSSITYSSVVSRVSVRIVFLVAALNDLEVVTADIGNAYLNAKTKEKIWTVAGKEFGAEEGQIMIIERALYGLKSSGAAWRSHLAETLGNLGFKQSKADPDVWLRENCAPKGEPYYEMMLVYVDDLLYISHDTKPIMDSIKGTYRLKEDSLKPPDKYLGATIKVHTDEQGYECWAMSSDEYVAHAVKSLESELESESGGKVKLRGKAYRPMPSGYRPEVDCTPELDEVGVQRYQALVGTLRWAVELGRIDIQNEVSMMSSHLALPREGHLEAIYHIFAFLKKHPVMALCFHPSRMNLNEKAFLQADWTEFYGDVKEDIPSWTPPPLGNSVKLTAFVDSDHAGNLVTRRSYTGYIIFVNNAPILWYSKKQNTVESSTFGSEFIAARTCVEAVEGLRYKLRMFGIPIDGVTDFMCDNQSVVNNTQRPESTLSKKHLSICYHRVREACARMIIRVGKVLSKENLADLFTKPLPTDQRNYLLEKMVVRDKDRLRTPGPNDSRLNC